jgi:hypothetical protein
MRQWSALENTWRFIPYVSMQLKWCPERIAQGKRMSGQERCRVLSLNVRTAQHHMDGDIYDRDF